MYVSKVRDLLANIVMSKKQDIWLCFELALPGDNDIYPQRPAILRALL